MKRITGIFLLLIFLTSCAAKDTETHSFPVHLALEQSEGYTADRYTAQVQPGERVTFTLTPAEGYNLTTAQGGDLQRSGGAYTLTVPAAKYSQTLSVEAVKSEVSITYHPNGGQGEEVSLPVLPTHLRLNTSTGQDLFARPGCTLMGWNTAPDGSGTAVGLGSRVDWQPGLTLYAQWAAWTDADCFDWTEYGSGVMVTGYHGQDTTLTVPAEIEGKPVYAIGKNACAGAECTTLILPPGLQRVEENAFADSGVETVILSDDINSITDYAFSGCSNLRTLRVNAVEPPAYSGSYFSTFADKYDRLLSLRERRKLVLFSGSSTRFGYDSPALEAGLEGYEVVNMGVFAYTSATPQLLLILDCMGEGDILLHSPEFDAAQRQFCTRADLEDHFWAMMEANYDMATALDLHQVSSAFSGLSAYLSEKSAMEPKRYDLSPADFDEDGNPVSTPSYNAYGDYCLYRPNAAEDAPVYGLGVDYTVAAFPKAQYIDSLNRMYQRFLDQGVQVFFTYAPRNREAISEDSTRSARKALDQWFRDNLNVPVISDIEESLYPGRYLSGTDNHLSTEGVAIRSRRILDDLHRAMEQEGAP